MEGLWVRQQCDSYVIVAPSITSAGVMGPGAGEGSGGGHAWFSCLGVDAWFPWQCLRECYIPSLILSVHKYCQELNVSNVKCVGSVEICLALLGFAILP